MRQWTIIGSNNGLAPDRRQAIIWINAGIYLMGPLGTNFSEIIIDIHALTFKKMPLKGRLQMATIQVSASISLH